MTLSTTSRLLLGGCSEAMATGYHPVINLLSMSGCFWNSETVVEVLDELARGVEKTSSNRLTVRQADMALFSLRFKGEALYVVVCKSSTPPGIVTELTEDMKLCTLGPYKFGLSFEERASPSDVLKDL